MEQSNLLDVICKINFEDFLAKYYPPDEIICRFLHLFAYDNNSYIKCVDGCLDSNPYVQLNYFVFSIKSIGTDVDGKRFCSEHILRLINEGHISTDVIHDLRLFHNHESVTSMIHSIIVISELTWYWLRRSMPFCLHLPECVNYAESLRNKRVSRSSLLKICRDNFNRCFYDLKNAFISNESFALSFVDFFREIKCINTEFYKLDNECRDPVGFLYINPEKTHIFCFCRYHIQSSTCSCLHHNMLYINDFMDSPLVDIIKSVDTVNM